jgi:hypothetical protein
MTETTGSTGAVASLVINWSVALDAGEVWRADYAVGRGHAMALFGVLKNGATISDKHVGSDTAHSDASNELRLDGIDRR